MNPVCLFNIRHNLRGKRKQNRMPLITPHLRISRFHLNNNNNKLYDILVKIKAKHTVPGLSSIYCLCQQSLVSIIIRKLSPTWEYCTKTAQYSVKHTFLFSAFRQIWFRCFCFIINSRENWVFLCAVLKLKWRMEMEAGIFTDGIIIRKLRPQMYRILVTEDKYIHVLTICFPILDGWG